MIPTSDNAVVAQVKHKQCLNPHSMILDCASEQVIPKQVKERFQLLSLQDTAGITTFKSEIKLGHFGFK